MLEIIFILNTQLPLRKEDEEQKLWISISKDFQSEQLTVRLKIGGIKHDLKYSVTTMGK